VVLWSVFTGDRVVSNFSHLLISRFSCSAWRGWRLSQIARQVFHAGFPGRSVAGRTALSGCQPSSGAIAPWLVIPFQQLTAGGCLSFLGIMGDGLALILVCWYRDNTGGEARRYRDGWPKSGKPRTSCS